MVIESGGKGQNVALRDLGSQKLQGVPKKGIKTNR